MAEAHYIRGYRKLLARLNKRYDEDQAASLVVGGEYELQGEILYRFLVDIGVKDGDVLIDVGCGSGRLSWALSNKPLQISYTGTDVVPELLEYARRRSGDAALNFQVVDGLYIPAERASADIVVFFSVLTHLDPMEQLTYLKEARRVLKSNGIIVASYIELGKMPPMFGVRFLLSSCKQAIFRNGLKSVASSNRKMQEFGRTLGMDCELLGPAVGQSVCIYRHREI